MHVHALTTLDGEIRFDLDPALVPGAALTTTFADGTDATGIDAAALAARARAATYLSATYELRLGGAAVGIRPRLLDTASQTHQRWAQEVQPLLDDGRLTLLDQADPECAWLARGVGAAAETWLSGLEGRTAAVDGFGAAGRAIARDLVRRGARLVAVATPRGAVAQAAGLDLDRLEQAAGEHGDRFVHHLGLEVHRPRELHELRVDVLVPGDEVGIFDADLAARVQAKVVVPAGPAPYTEEGLASLRAGGVAALPGFVTAGGLAVAHQASPALTAAEFARAVDREVGGRVDAARMAKLDPHRHATLLAETFLATWLAPEQRPDGLVAAP